MENKISNKRQILLVILCWAILTFAYLGRYSYTSNGVPIKRFYGVNSDEFSLATTFFFFAYGISQVISGFLCRRFNMRIVIPISLFLSSIINLSVFLGLPFYLIKYLWLINGISQAILWPSLLRIISCYLDDKNMKFGVIAMGTTQAAGTFLSYGISALLALFDGFLYSFLLGALLMIFIAIITILFYGNLTNKRRIENLLKTSSDVKADTTNADKKYHILIAIFILFGIYAIVINFIKDGLTTWVPHILSDRYNVSDSLSMTLTLVLPLFGVFGVIFAVTLNKIFKDHSNLAGIIFALSSLCMLGIILFFKTKYWYFILVFFGLVYMLMVADNNVVASMLPLSIGKTYNAGLVGGVLSGACYLGSTLSQYGIASIATLTSWDTVMNILMYLCVIFAFVSLVVKIFKTIFKKKGE